MSKTNAEKYELIGERVSIFQRGPRWYVHYRLDGKPVRQSLKTSSKKEARRRALGVERDLINGEIQRPTRAPLIKDVVEQYISHLRGLGRSENTIRKYQFCYKLLLDLAVQRRVSRIDQIDLALIDAFRLQREIHRVTPKKITSDDQGQTKNDSQ